MMPPVVIPQQCRTVPNVEPEAAAWLHKAIHPPGPTPASQCPDETSLCSAAPEFRCEHVITAQGTPGLALGASWDCMIIKYPGNGQAFTALTGPAGINFATTAYGSLGIQRPTFSDTTMTPTFGQVYATSIGTNGLLGNPCPVFTAKNVGEPLLWRKTASSITAYMTASSTTNQGSVYATQLGRKFKRFATMLGTTELSGIIDSRMIFNGVTTTLVYDEENMAALDPKLYCADAKEGVYIPLKFFGNGAWVKPSLGLGDVTTTNLFPVTPGTRGPAWVYPCSDAPVPPVLFNPLGVWPFPTWDNAGVLTRIVSLEDPINTAVCNPQDTGMDEWGTAVIIFRGLDYSATITCKTIDVIESVPSSTSPYRPFVRPPLRYSPNAMLLYETMVQRSPNAYPANFNSWGKVWDVIKNVAKELWPIVKPVIVKGITGGLEGLTSTRTQVIAPQRGVTGSLVSSVVTRPRASSVASSRGSLATKKVRVLGKAKRKR